jgi:mevalonate pyrophosphate decarboxylase
MLRTGDALRNQSLQPIQQLQAKTHMILRKVKTKRQELVSTIDTGSVVVILCTSPSNASFKHSSLSVILLSILGIQKDAPELDSHYRVEP